MEVILLEKIHKLGDLGETVNVRPGYGRNYLIPKRMAVPATAENVAKFEEQRAELERAQAEGMASAEARAEARADTLRGIEVTIKANAGSEGKLFGSVGTSDIAEAIVAAGGAVEKREIRLPEGPMREVGDYEVGIHLHADVDVVVKLTIVAEDVESTA